jgi:exopolysaccharide biosynthesis polyprenyl glycosylphosphotransferase
MSLAIAVSDLASMTVVMLAAAPEPGAWGKWAFLAGAASLLAAQGQFRSRLTLTVAGDVGPVLLALSAPLVAVAMMGGFGAHVTGFLWAGGVGGVVVVATRAALYAVFRALRVRGRLIEPTLVIGTGAMAVRFSGVLSEHPEYGLLPVGFLDDADGEALPGPLLGHTPQLPSVLVEHGVQRVVIAFGAARESAMVDIVRACADAWAKVHVLPRFFEMGWTPRHYQMDDVWGYPLWRLPHSSWRPTTRLVKRSFDIAVAGAVLVLLSPLYAALALAVKLSSPGPVYFRQIRVGERSRRVEILKFRSMRVNDDADVTWDVGDDERITPVGRLMRDLSLDELPQLWNVVRGDMSLVGPRPERPYFVERFRAEVHHYDRRHRMPGGLTGLAQVHGLRGARTSIDDRARLDNHYIQTWSFWRELHIPVRTPFVIVHHAWCHRAVRASATPAPPTARRHERRTSNALEAALALRATRASGRQGRHGDDGRRRGSDSARVIARHSEAAPPAPRHGSRPGVLPPGTYRVVARTRAADRSGDAGETEPMAATARAVSLVVGPPGDGAGGNGAGGNGWSPAGDPSP